MKSSRLIFLLSILTLSFFALQVPEASADNGVYKIDFGPGASATNLTGWNNATEGTILGSTVATLPLVDSAGATSTAVLRFTDAGDCGVNTPGQTGNTLGYPETAGSDFTYGGPCGTGKTSFGLVFTGLNQAYTYNLKLYAARLNVGGSRLTTLRVGTTTSTVEALGNTSNLAIVSNITPSATSSIEFRVEQGTAGQFFYINVIELVINTLPNNPPTVDAGPDLVLSATSTSVNLASTVSDSDGTVTNTSWSIVSGPAGAAFSTTTATSTTLSGLSPGKYAVTLSAIDNGGAASLDNLIVTVLPPLYQSGKPAKKITFLGGSITAGTGASNIGSSWAGLYSDYAKIYNASTTVQNLGVSGYTSADVMNNSLASAGAFAPDAVIFGFPTNDGASSTISTSTSVSNLNTIVNYFTTRNIPIWIATPSARNGLPNANLVWMKDYILANYGTKAINFFDTYANADGSFNGTAYCSCDGVHPNDAGHTLLYKQAIGANVIETLYASTSTAPTSVVGTSSSNQATVSWSAPSSNGGIPVLAYKVYQNNTLATTTASTTRSYTGTGLTNGTSYAYYVTAINGVGESASSTFVSVIPAGVPGQPTSPTISRGAGQLTVVWSQPSTNGGSVVTGYKLYNGGNGSVATTTASTTTSFTVTGLANGTSYSYYITALNIVGESASSTAVSTTTFDVPGAPTGVAAIPGNATATVFWIPPVSTGGSPITLYTVTSNPGNVIATTTPTSTIVTGLTNGTFYNFTVTASNIVGASVSSSASNSITPNTVPNAPTSVVASSPSPNQATVSWIAPAFNGGSTLTGYKVYDASTGVVATTTGVSTNSFAVKGLSNGTSYAYYVTALNATGESSSSTVSNAVIPTAPAATSVTSYLSPGSSSSGPGSIPASLLSFINQTPIVSTGMVSVSFSKSLSLGNRGDDVKKLRQYLNAKGFVVAQAGAGSKGKETNLFGPATKAALIRFQKANKISATGFFGPLTRAAIK